MNIFHINQSLTLPLLLPTIWNIKEGMVESGMTYLVYFFQTKSPLLYGLLRFR